MPNQTAFIFGTGSFSLAFWYKSTGESVVGCPLSKDNGSGTSWLVYFYNNGNINFFPGNPGGQSVATSSPTTSMNGSWHHYVFTNSAGSQAVYMDGVSINTGSLVGVNPTLTEPIRLGIEDTVDWPASGAEDDVRVYNRLLTSTDVTELYNWRGNASNTIIGSGIIGKLNS